MATRRVGDTIRVNLGLAIVSEERIVDDGEHKVVPRIVSDDICFVFLTRNPCDTRIG